MKKRFLSIIIALAMMVGVFTPLITNADDETPTTTVTKEDVVGTIEPTDLQKAKPETTGLTIHKLVADKLNITKGLDHNGGKLKEEQYKKLGTNVKPLDGVKFTIYKIERAEDFKAIQDANPKTTEAMQKYVDGGQATLVKETVATDANGEVTENLAEGNYWVVESERPSRVTESLAVPFAITLPLLNQVDVKNGENTIKAGTQYMKNVHVYPKNTQSKPQMDKAFGKREDLKDQIDSSEYKKMLADWKATYGPKLDEYTRKKDLIDARVGSKVPYEVQTKLIQGQKYTTLSWSDIMTTGIEYNKDLTISYKSGEKTVEVRTAKITNKGTYGFDAVINDTETINAINKALETGEVVFTLKYTATVTNDAVVDLPESNSITFTPAEPSHSNNNTPKNPTNGEVTVNKTWAKGEAPKGVLVTYILYEGENPIASVTLNEGKIQSQSVPENVTVTADGYNVKFSGLDNAKTYKVEEFADGYDPSYQGAFGVENTANPDRITPSPVEVVTYGKKFVKTDNSADKTRLAGAEFVVKNGKGEDAKYLVAKTDAKIAKEQEAVKNAKAALDTAVEEYNKLDKAAQTDEARAKVTSAQEKYNAAVKAAGNVYEWGDKANAIALVSDGQGKFEITGLAAGTYYLEETKAPKGFAKLTSDEEFKVSANSYKSEGNINYKHDAAEGAAKDANQVINKNLTIPQTGGIGTIIFTAIGLAIMASAIIAIKKRQATEAR